MQIRDLKLGDRCVVFLDARGEVVGEETDYSVSATVIIADPNDRTRPLALGWKPQEPQPDYRFTYSGYTSGSPPNPRHKIIDNLADYHRILWAIGDFLIGGRVASDCPSPAKQATKSPGEFCSGCKGFFAYSEPNNSNGTLTCFNCRKYPHYRSVADDDY